MHSYNSTTKSTENYTIFYNDLRYNKNNKSAKLFYERLDQGYYEIRCSVYNNDIKKNTGIDVKSFFVGTKAEPVQNFTCINYAFDKLVCSFDAPYNPVATDYTVEIRAGNQVGSLNTIFFLLINY